MTFKIAVIGCGWVSMDCHGPAYARYAQTHPGIELTACCDLDAQRPPRSLRVSVFYTPMRITRRCYKPKNRMRCV